MILKMQKNIINKQLTQRQRNMFIDMIMVSFDKIMVNIKRHWYNLQKQWNLLKMIQIISWNVDILMAMGDYDRGMKYVERALQLDNGDKLTHFYYGS